MNHIVVVGAGYAGVLAALRAARSSYTSVTLINPTLSWNQRIRWHEVLAGTAPHQLLLPEFLQRRGVTFQQGWVESLDRSMQQLHVRAHSGSYVVPFDHAVLALGCYSFSHMPGVQENALHLNDPKALQKMAQQLPSLAQRQARMLVVGGGLTGIEVATELAERWPGLQITLATHSPLGADLSAAAQMYLKQTFIRLGIKLREGAAITHLEPNQAYGADSQVLPFDLCVWCAGFAAPPLLRESGLKADTHGRALVDQFLQAEPHISVVGDAAALPYAASTLRMGCVSAMPLGAYAGDRLAKQAAGQAVEPFSMGFSARCISLGRRDALVQWVHKDDSLKQQIWTGWRARMIKEGICKAVGLTIKAELSYGLPLYRWSRNPKSLRHTVSQNLS